MGPTGPTTSLAHPEGRAHLVKKAQLSTRDKVWGSIPTRRRPRPFVAVVLERRGQKQRSPSCQLILRSRGERGTLLRSITTEVRPYLCSARRSSIDNVGAARRLWSRHLPTPKRKPLVKHQALSNTVTSSAHGICPTTTETERHVPYDMPCPQATNRGARSRRSPTLERAHLTPWRKQRQRAPVEGRAA